VTGPRRILIVAVGVTVIVLAVVVVGRHHNSGSSAGGIGSPGAVAGSSDASSPDPSSGYPGMPPVVDQNNIYSEIAPNKLQSGVAGDVSRVYVPDSLSDTVSVIDPTTHAVVSTFKTGREPQHIVPSYDLRTLWVLDNQGNTVIPINAVDGKPGAPLPVEDPYNLYFTPDGNQAIVVAEARDRLDFRDPHTMKLESSLSVPGCDGINHSDYNADGAYLIVTCEFAGKLAKIDIVHHQVVAMLDMAALKLPGQPHPKAMAMPNGRSGTSMPQDVRVGPDGRHFYVADMLAGGVFVVDGDTFTATQFISTGEGAHGITPSRDGKHLYIADRGSMLIDGPPHGPGNVAVIDTTSNAVTATWQLPGGGSPDMGNLDAAGAHLWLSGRFDSEVYEFDTATGALVARIPVGRGPHGLTVWPQPGRYSLGHTGNMR
jgi:YVTN family beta-propeller protein